MNANNSKSSKVEQLKKKREELNARIQKLEASEKARDRKKDTRRKILIGSYYLEEARKNSKMDEIKHLMDGFLTRDSDRIIFDLPKQQK